MSDARVTPSILQRVRSGIVGLATIVLGVAIALAADSAREGWSERAMADAYLSGLESDLRTDSAQFEEFLRPYYLPAQAAAVDTLLEVLGDPSMEMEGFRVLKHIRSSALLSAARKQRATFDDLVGSGRLSLLRDDALRIDIVQYYAESAVTDDAAYEAFLQVAFYPYLHRLAVVLDIGRYQAAMSCEQGDLDCFARASRGDELGLVRRDPELGAYISDQQIQRFFALAGIRSGLTQVNGLLRRLEGSTP